ncbi:response regulator transcription factor [Limnohabitans sp. DCL3]|uniref:response regulator transcription factor n=1 Tax=Limnohabitans sp. DCL3 TaxID=3374103 RepID=UPI003A857A63
MSPKPCGHVYVVDDNRDIRFYLTDLLRQMGHSVECFDSAKSFLAHSLDIFPAVLVLDVRMPQMSGIELQRELRALGRHIPIIFISGESHSEDIILAMKGQPIEFLLKPFQFPRLMEAIEKGLVLDGIHREQRFRKTDIHRKWTALSARERDVFVLMLDGLTNKGISERLGILPDTAKKHRANVLQKMETTDLAQLVALCKGVDVKTLG